MSPRSRSLSLLFSLSMISSSLSIDLLLSQWIHSDGGAQRATRGGGARGLEGKGRLAREEWHRSLGWWKLWRRDRVMAHGGMAPRVATDSEKMGCHCGAHSSKRARCRALQWPVDATKGGQRAWRQSSWRRRLTGCLVVRSFSCSLHPATMGLDRVTARRDLAMRRRDVATARPDRRGSD
jgi:hypothetical protein